MASKPNETQSVPGGTLGGRVRVPLRVNSEGIDVAIDPENDIYSGMLKRGARQDGYFTKPGPRSDVQPEDLL